MTSNDNNRAIPNSRLLEQYPVIVIDPFESFVSSFYRLMSVDDMALIRESRSDNGKLLYRYSVVPRDDLEFNRGAVVISEEQVLRNIDAFMTLSDFAFDQYDEALTEYSDNSKR